MKKMILMLVAAIVAATATYAQSSMLATLSHEGTISTYYGSSALKDAYAAAVDGDVITLSSGSFTATDITKGITIRGAGMGIDAQTKSDPTILTGDFTINIPAESTGRLTLEGISHNEKLTIIGTFNNGTFIKSRFYNIYGWNAESITNLTMIHCRVAYEFEMSRNYSRNSGSIVNSIICDLQYARNIDIVNSVLTANRNNGFSSIGSSLSLKNCILYSQYSSSLDGTNTVYNCVGNQSKTFNNIHNGTNKVAEMTSIFKTFTGTYADDEMFELTDEAKTTYLGLDGTQIGIHGGNMPFSSTPSNPQITKCNVAAKSTADGKLSVDITVSGAE